MNDNKTQSIKFTDADGTERILLSGTAASLERYTTPEVLARVIAQMPDEQLSSINDHLESSGVYRLLVRGPLVKELAETKAKLEAKDQELDELKFELMKKL